MHFATPVLSAQLIEDAVGTSLEVTDLAQINTILSDEEEMGKVLPRSWKA